MANVTDGTVVWTIKTISNFLPLSGGTITGAIKPAYSMNVIQGDTTSNVIIASGRSWNDSPSVILYPTNTQQESLKGVFNIRAGGEGEAKEFIGRPNGRLTWGGNEILTQNAYSQPSHGVALQLGSILFMAGQVQASSATTAFTINFPKAFANGNQYGVSVNAYSTDGVARKCTITYQSASSIKVTLDVASTWVFYVAIGIA